jgi:hypothetical protein
MSTAGLLREVPGLKPEGEQLAEQFLAIGPVGVVVPAEVAQEEVGLLDRALDAVAARQFGVLLATAPLEIEAVRVADATLWFAHCPSAGSSYSIHTGPTIGRSEVIL